MSNLSVIEVAHINCVTGYDKRRELCTTLGGDDNNHNDDDEDYDLMNVIP